MKLLQPAACSRSFFREPLLACILCPLLFRAALVFSVLLVGAPRVVFGQAQAFTATLNGTVFDTSGAVIAQATVNLSDPGRGINRRAVSSEAGTFSFAAMPAGTYEMRVESPGFKTGVQSNITLNVGQVATVNLKLSPGDVSERVEVNAERPLLNVDNSNIGLEINNRTIVETPLNLRNVFGLVFLNSSVNNSAIIQRLNPAGIRSDFDDQNIAFFNFGGARFGTTAFLVDGIWDAAGDWGGTMYVPGVDEVQEFKTQTNSFTAQYGWSMGNVVNAITKSGSSSFHGSAFEFFRHEKLAANNFFNNARGFARPTFRQHQFGAQAGGPLYIPGLYRQRNKTFVYGSYQGRRQTNPINFITTVPTAQMKAGDFSAFLRGGNAGLIYDPLSTVLLPNGAVTRTVFQGNRIPTSRINPITAGLLRYWPEPTSPGLSNNFSTVANSPAEEDAYTVRVDHNFTDQTRFFSRWSQKRQFLTLGAPYFGTDNPAGPENRVPDNRFQFAANLTHVFSPTVVLSATVGMNRWVEQRSPQGQGFLPSALGFPSLIDGVAPNFPSISISGVFGLGQALNGGGAPNSVPREARTYAVDVTKNAGAHNLTFGFMAVDFRQNPQFGNQFGLGFGAGETRGPDPNAGANVTSGIGFASFLLGTASGGNVGNNAFTAFQKTFAGWYAQDDWKIRPNLTINLGLRYEFQTAPTERFNRMAFFDWNAINPLSQTTGLNLRGNYVFAGNGQPRNAYDPQYTNFAPRIGFAWQPYSRLVMRGGAAIFYIPAIQFTQPTPGFSQGTPFVGVQNSLVVGNIANPFPNGLIAPAGSSRGALQDGGFGVDAIVRTRPTPYMSQWTYSLGLRLSPNDSFEMSYIGNHGVKLPMGGYEQNQLAPQYLGLGQRLRTLVPNPFYRQITTSSCGLNLPTVQYGQLLRPFPQYCSVNQHQAVASSSWYHALVLEYNHRFSSGFQMLASFTWAKYLSNASGQQNWASGPSDAIRNHYDLALEKSLDPNDIPRSLVLNWIYDVPVGRGKKYGSKMNKAVDAVAGGWQVSGVVTLKDGFPLSITAPNNTGSYGGNQRPNLVGNPSLTNQTVSAWFNVNAFAQPADFTFGNVGRTMPNLRAPGYQNWDLAVHKFFNFTETTRLQFRAEAFNSWNHPNFYQPDTSFNQSPGSTFGQITNTLPGREVQLALKLLW